MRFECWRMGDKKKGDWTLDFGSGECLPEREKMRALKVRRDMHVDSSSLETFFSESLVDRSQN
jgi:hypothetical protein